MDICIEKVAMIRPLENPRNCNLSLEMDWSIDYIHEDQNKIGYNCILKSLYLDLNLKIEGFLFLESFERFDQETCSQFILDNTFGVLMKIFSLTGKSTYNLSECEYVAQMSKHDIHSTL